MTFPLDLANLVAIWLESIFYGAYVLLFFHTVHALHRPRPNSKHSNTTNWTLLGACVGLLVLSTSHMAISFRMLIEAFILDKKFPGGANTYFAEEGMPLSVGRKAVFTLSAVLADTLLIYRCYVLWHKNLFIIIIPVLTLCGTVVSSTFIAKQLINFQPTVEEGIFTPQLSAWVPAFFFLTFGSSIYLSICIAWKLWYAARKAQPDMLQFKRTFAAVVVVESNSIYPFISIIAVLFFAAESNVQVIPVNVLAQIVAIAPTLMILQVQQGLYSPYAYPKYPDESSSKSDGTNRGSFDNYTDFTRPYVFMPVPECSGVHFPSLFRTASTKTFKDRRRTLTNKGEGGIAYTKYGGTFGMGANDRALKLVSPKSSMQISGMITVTSTVDVYEGKELDHV